ncbi:dihydrodipicolinate synthase family protein [Pseudolysinimonas sp.]
MRLGPRRLLGVSPVLVTPFDERDRIDEEALVAELAFLVDRGIAVCVIGLASEIQRLSWGERVGLVRSVRAAWGDRTLVVGASADSTEAARRFAAETADAGADVLMVTPPRTAGVEDLALLDHFRAVATDSGLELVVQDAPQSTRVTMSDALLLRLCEELPQVSSLKLESDDALDRIDRLAEIVTDMQVTIVGGGGGLDYPTEFALGARGTMPGPAVPELFQAVDAALVAGDPDTARRTILASDGVLSVARRGLDQFTMAQKRILARRGVPMREALRSPAPPLEPWIARSLDAALDRLPDTWPSCRKGL